MTNLSIEERLQIIREIYLVVGHNDNITSANGPRVDFFHLTGAILEDKVYPCTLKQRLIGALKKSPVWKKVLPFIQNNDTTCGRKKCGCSEYNHNGKGKSCKGMHYKKDTSKSKFNYSYIRVPCECPQYVKKEFV